MLSEIRKQFFFCVILTLDDCRNAFDDHHTVYADALLDKGFFLLNVDSINKSVEVYMVRLLINSFVDVTIAKQARIITELIKLFFFFCPFRKL